jgi:DNA-binding response OmpR family regulator
VTETNNILILDDCVKICSVISNMLKHYCDDKVNILQANTYDKASKIFKENKIDIVLTDIELNDGMEEGGLKFLLKVKLFDESIPVFVMSGSDCKREYIIELGADDFFSKPFNLREVVIRIMDKLASCYQY